MGPGWCLLPSFPTKRHPCGLEPQPGGGCGSNELKPCFLALLGRLLI